MNLAYRKLILNFKPKRISKAKADLNLDPVPNSHPKSDPKPRLKRNLKPNVSPNLNPSLNFDPDPNAKPCQNI